MASALVKTVAVVLAVLLCLDHVEAGFKLKAIRKAIQVAARYGDSYIGGTVVGKQAVRVLREVNSKLAYLGLNHYVSLQEFALAAERLGLHRQVGIAVYHAMNILLP